MFENGKKTPTTITDQMLNTILINDLKQKKQKIFLAAKKKKKTIDGQCTRNMQRKWNFCFVADHLINDSKCD